MFVIIPTYGPLVSLWNRELVLRSLSVVVHFTEVIKVNTCLVSTWYEMTRHEEKPYITLTQPSPKELSCFHNRECRRHFPHLLHTVAIWLSTVPVPCLPQWSQTIFANASSNLLSSRMVFLLLNDCAYIFCNCTIFFEDQTQVTWGLKDTKDEREAVSWSSINMFVQQLCDV